MAQACSRRVALTKIESDDLEWMLREAGSGARSEFINTPESLGIPSSPRMTMECPSDEAIRAAVEAGRTT